MPQAVQSLDGALPCRHAKQANFCCGIEAEAEENAKRVHLPGMIDDPENTTKHTCQKTAVGQHVFEILLEETTTVAQDAKHATDRDQHHDVGSCDGKQEQRRGQSRDHPAAVLEQIELVLK